MARYKVVRKYRDLRQPSETVARGLTLQEAQKHCSDPETSSRTCLSVEGLNRTFQKGEWFDAYYRQESSE